MAMFSKDCLNAATQKLTNFSKEEVEAYLSEVFALAKEYDSLGSQASFNKAIKKVNNEKLEALLEDSTITANNARKFEKMSELIKQDKASLNELTIRARTGKNTDFNIESAQRAKYNEFYKLMHDPLTPEETKYLVDAQNSLEIGRAIGGKSNNPMANKIAEIHKKLVNYIQSDMVTSNAMPLHAMNKERQINATHDRTKMLHPNKNPFKILTNIKKYTTDEAKSLWMTEIKKHLNLLKTYKKIGAIDKNGNLNMAKVDKHLGNTFDNIINGHSEIFTKSGVKKDLEAIKKRQQMFFVFKDTEAWLKYNKVYGSGDYHSALSSYIRSSANKVGTAEIFGDNSRNMFMNLLDVQTKANKKALGSQFNVENNFKYITGIDQAAANPSVAAFSSNVRTLLGMARMGSIGILSVGDVVKGASHLQTFGLGFWKPLLSNIQHIFDNKLFEAKDREYIAQVFKLNLDSQIGYLGKFLDANTPGDMMSKFTNGFYKINLMHALDKGNKTGVMTMTSKGIGNQSKHGWSKLNKHLKNQLEKYNINESEWELLRHKNEMVDNHSMFTTDNVEKLTDKELKLLQVGENEKTPLYEIKNSLMRKVYTLFDVANAASIGQPDTYMKAFLLGGTKAGTPAGEALRAVGQFKAFFMQHIDRMYINNYKNVDGTKAKSIYFLNMFAASVGLNIISNALGDYASGKSMPSFHRMNKVEKAKYIMENLDANLGLLNKAFSNSYPGKFKLAYLMSSPTTHFLGDIIDIMTNSGMGLTGDKKSWKRAGKSAKAAAKAVMPISTMPIISPYLDKLMGNKPYLEPGQKQIFAK